MELYQLEQLVAFAEFGTLSKAAEILHLTQPTLSRSMQKLEAEFDVPLFYRSKNKLEFHENGRLAAEHAKKVLDQAKDMVSLVRAFDRQNRTLSFGACAQMPMLSLAQNAAGLYPDMTVSTEMRDSGGLLKGLREGRYHAVILPFRPEGEDLYVEAFGTETLSFALPPGHRFAGREGVFMEELDGESILLLSDIGFWYDICKEKMPRSHTLLQSGRFAFDELVQSSVLPSFVTDVAMRMQGAPENRKIVPILDPEAFAEYYAACMKADKRKFGGLFERH